MKIILAILFISASSFAGSLEPVTTTVEKVLGQKLTQHRVDIAGLNDECRVSAYLKNWDLKGKGLRTPIIYVQLFDKKKFVLFSSKFFPDENEDECYVSDQSENKITARCPARECENAGCLFPEEIITVTLDSVKVGQLTCRLK